VRESPLLARIALALNIVGTILLALSFQATSSDFRFINARGYDHYGNLSPGNTAYAVCIRDYAVILTDTVTGTALGRPAVVQTGSKPFQARWSPQSILPFFGKDWVYRRLYF
jgi:hypothetical protein